MPPFQATNLILPKRYWNYDLQLISNALFWSATLNLIVVGITRNLSYQIPVLISAGLYLLGFLCFFTGRTLTKHGYKKLKTSVKAWADKKYGVSFTEQELRSLIMPAHSGFNKNKNYHSRSVNQWYEVDNGRKEKATFSIVIVDGEPILYRAEIAGEFTTEEDRNRQRIITEFAEEIGGNKTVYLYNETNVMNPNPSSDPTLLWSDPLRVDLFLGADTTTNRTAIYAIPVDVFFESWVPSAVNKGLQVGINWDANDYLFDTKKIFVSN